MEPVCFTTPFLCHFACPRELKARRRGAKVRRRGAIGAAGSLNSVVHRLCRRIRQPATFKMSNFGIRKTRAISGESEAKSGTERARHNNHFISISCTLSRVIGDANPNRIWQNLKASSAAELIPQVDLLQKANAQRGPPN
jgi:hypothetical protein